MQKRRHRTCHLTIKQRELLTAKPLARTVRARFGSALMLRKSTLPTFPEGASARAPNRVPRPPWFSFWIGGLCALALTWPLLSLATGLLRPHPAGAETRAALFRLTLVFTALPTFLTGGGPGRPGSAALP